MERGSQRQLLRRHVFAWAGAGALACIALSSAGISLAQWRSQGQSRELLSAQPPAGGEPTTMLEALAAAREVIVGWGPGWTIASVASVDVEDSPGEGSGEDGRRRSWNIAAVNSSGEERWVRVVAGQPVLATVASEPGGVAPEHADINPGVLIDSDHAVSLARQRIPGFAGGSDPKGRGIHFALGLDPLTSQLRLSVRGRLGTEVVRVLIDPVAGTGLSIEHLVFGSVLYRSGDGGRTWSAVASALAPLAVTSDHEGALFSAALDHGAIAVFQHVNDASARLAVLPAEAGAWVRALTAVGRTDGGDLIVAAERGLWTVRTRDGAVSQLAAGTYMRVMIDGSGRVHAIRVDGPGSTTHLAEQPDGQLAPVRGDDGAQKLASMGGGVVAFGPAGASIPGVADALAAAGGERIELASSMSGQLYVSSDGGKSWRASAYPGSGPVVEIALAPNWETSGVALAREYRGAIWRTTDHGATWRAVLHDAGELSGVAFGIGSADNVLAIASGGETWLPY